MVDSSVNQAVRTSLDIFLTTSSTIRFSSGASLRGVAPQCDAVLVSDQRTDLAFDR